jgi:phosphoglycolate phosphatase-like HAD superfamily hydrolase
MEEVFGTASRLDSHNFGGKTDWQTLVELLEEHGYDEARVGEYMDRFAESMARHTAAIIGSYPTQPCPGAIEVIQDLRQRDDLLLGLVTGNVALNVPVKLRAAGFDPGWFPVGAFGNDARHRNDLPPIALARAIVHYQQHIEPKQVIVIGDTPMDVACARALGAVAVAVRTGFCKPGELEDAAPDIILEDLTYFKSEVLGE